MIKLSENARKYNMGGVTVKTFLFVLEAVLGLVVVVSILMQKGWDAFNAKTKTLTY